MAQDAIEVLDAEGIERAHVVGASMGGVIAQIIGVMHPDRVRLARRSRAPRAATTTGAASCSPSGPNAVNERGMTALSDDGMRWLIGPRLQRRFGVFVNVLARVLDADEAARVRRPGRRDPRRPDELRVELPTITAPTLVITGSQDTLTPLGDAEELAELIPTSRLVRAARRRARLMAEAPNAFNDVVLQFLDEIDAAERPRRSIAASRSRAVQYQDRRAGAGGAR